jgi:galactose-6-phosphate isomerase
MPTLNVSRVLLSREFVDKTLVCARNAQTIGSDGIAVDTPTSTPFYGVVTSDRGDVLMRAAEGSHISGTIYVYSKYILIAGRNGTDADVVQWNGRQFTVTDINDYSQYGAGFTCARCELIPLRGS